MIQDLKQQKGRPLDRAYLIDAFELCRISARVYARYRWRYADWLTLRIAMNKYKTVSDFLFPFVRLVTPVGSCRRHVPIGGAISVKRRSSKGLSWL